MKNNRFWEIDFLRGIAILMMIVFHFAYDLNYLNIYNFDIDSSNWTVFRVLIVSIFFLLVGISLTLSKSKDRNLTHFVKRGIKIFFWGMIITFFTYLFIKEGYVRFGVLHFIGISIILAYPFLKFKYLNLIFALPVIIFGFYISKFSFNFGWLLWLGFKPVGFYTVDYFPILPFFGAILLGIFLGKILYKNGKRSFKIKDFSSNTIIKSIDFMGAKSLLIYLIHQPLLLGILHLLTY